MTNYQSMSATFEREKNIRASLYTLGICVLLFLLFFFLQWTLPVIPPPELGEGIEVNLGNSETGSGAIAPQIPGDPSLAEDKKISPPESNTPAVSQPKINTDEYADGDAPSINKTKSKPANKPLIHPVTMVKKKMVEPVTHPAPVEAKPKAVFKGGTATASSGNRADSYNGVQNQGIAGGKGDQGNSSGNPNSDSYKGNAASGNGGLGGNSGVKIKSGLNGRNITRYPNFEDDFNENAKVAVDITVDNSGNVTRAIVNQKGTTTTNKNILSIAVRKATLLKLNAANAAEQSGTLIFNFKLHG